MMMVVVCDAPIGDTAKMMMLILDICDACISFLNHASFTVHFIGIIFPLATLN